jgi:hypothetical protein
MGIKNAISLDGGFSAQAIVKENGNKKYLLNDPEKRNIGLSLSFTVN